ILDIIFKNNKVTSAVPGGSTFNSIISLGRCKAKAFLLSETGDDRTGRYITDFMNANGVNTDYMLRHPGMSTPVSLAFLDEHNEAEYTFYRSADINLPDLRYPDVNADDVVLFGSYYAIDARGRERVREFLDYAHNQGAILYYDINFRPAHKEELVKLMPNIIDNLELADIVRGSRGDFETIYKISEAEKLYRSELSFYCPNLIYTDGARPVSIFGKDFRKDYPTPSGGEIISTIGAGDSFNAGFIYGLLTGGITRGALYEGLSESRWDGLITTAQRFAADCCADMYNYITPSFAARL
ncbi:MAG: carbohydrate kinase, partial [Prevotella sp.]|nr:carbohydrate kinase [Prevotella sp.]